MSDAERDNAGVIAPPPLIFGGPFLLGLLLHRVWPAPFGPPRFARLLGVPLLLGGMAGAGWFGATMRQAGTTFEPNEPVTRIVTWGPFRYSRNPAYTSMTAFYVGLAGVLNTRWPLVFLPAVLLTLRHGVIAREERYLARKFGAEYTDYRARVRRWL
jgi:protein-S-isoprenylcysteine O-methyltransferase Ste14